MLLGASWEVQNFGVANTTVLKAGDFPYVQQADYNAALAYKPDVVVIVLGTNDSKSQNFDAHPNDFEPDYCDLIAQFRQVNPAVKIYACLPMPIFPAVHHVNESDLVAKVIPAIQAAAAQSGVPIIDLHTALMGKDRYFYDGVHPSEEGALLMADAVYQGITGLHAPPVRKTPVGLTILLLGDSITVGHTDPLVGGGGSGYRDRLYARLTGAGVKFQFEGSSITNASSTLRVAGQDFHEGHNSYQLSDLLNNLDTYQVGPSNSSDGGYWLTGGHNTDREAITPDMVLLLAGINDIGSKTPLETIQQRMTAVLDWFGSNRPNTRVFVGTLLPYDDALKKTDNYTGKVRAFNDWLRDTLPTQYPHTVTVVDQYSLFVDAQDNLKTSNSPDGIYLTDGMHPSHNGYMAMGDAWFAAMQPFLPVPPVTSLEVPSLVVTSTDDVIDPLDGKTTLREAITYANTLSGTPTISFDPQIFNATQKTITLNGTRLPDISTSMSIVGSSGGIVIDAGGKSDIVWTTGSNVTLDSLTFINGGDQSVQDSAGTLSIESCTFFHNSQAVGSSASTALTLHNSTVSDNAVGVFARDSSNLTLTNCTVTGNTVGLSNEGTLSTFSVSNTIVANNSVADTDTPVLASSFSIIGGDAGLDPAGLRDNGGATPTIALLLDSPAINVGDPTFDGTGQNDQRGEGFARVRSGGLDIGAFEAQNLPPLTKNESYSTPEDTALAVSAPQGVLINDSDRDGNNSLSATLASGPTNGKLSLATTGAFSYRPNLNFNGTDSFTYLVSHGRLSALATATITVTPVNDAPSATVTLSPSSPTTNAVLQANAKGYDVDGNRVTFSYVWKKNGLVLSSQRGVTLDLSRPDVGDKGDKISVVVTPSDGRLTGQGATATLTVGNSAPTLSVATFQGRENQTLSAQVAGQDADKEALFYSPLTRPRYGTLVFQSSGAFLYTPKANWNGTDSFQVRVRDASGVAATALLTLNVVPVNGIPIAVNDVVKGLEDTPLSIAASTLLKNDLNGEAADEVDALKIIQVAVSSDFPGTLRLDVVRQTIVFTPRLNWNGTTNFTYAVQDSGKAIAKGQVTVQIAPVNDAPVALRGRLTVLSGTLGELPLSGSDVEGDALTFGLGAKPTNGAAQVGKVGEQWLLRYRSKVGFVGTDTLSVIARDGKLNSVPVTIIITVKPNSAPQLVSLTPNKGSFPAGSSLVLEQKVRDANGTANLDATALLIGNSPAANARGGATLRFDAVANQFTLTKDDGATTLAPVALGGVLENSQVKVTLAAGYVVRDNSGNLTLRWHVTFKPGFVGIKSLWMRVEDLGGLSAGFTNVGSLTLTTPPKGSAPTS